MWLRHSESCVIWETFDFNAQVLVYRTFVSEGELFRALFKAVNEALYRFLVSTEYYAVIHINQNDDVRRGRLECIDRGIARFSTGDL